MNIDTYTVVSLFVVRTYEVVRTLTFKLLVYHYTIKYVLIKKKHSFYHHNTEGWYNIFSI